MFFADAQIAQLVEQRTENPRVAGSIPALSILQVWFNGRTPAFQAGYVGSIPITCFYYAKTSSDAWGFLHNHLFIGNDKDVRSNNIMEVFALFFSPTGNTCEVTRAVAGGIAKVLSKGDFFSIDLTAKGDRFSVYDFGPEDVVVLGMPTYAGRIPNKIAPYVEESIYGEGATVIPVVTYGNRAYDDSLKELATIASENGMKIGSAVAMPCEHAFSDKLANARPTEADIKQLARYGEEIGEKIKKGEALIDVDSLPGRKLDESEYYKPLREDGEAAKFLKAMVITDADKCTGCGACKEICPMGCFDKSPLIPEGICIKCHGCVHVCPNKAKHFEDEDLASHIRMLEKTYSNEDRQIEVFW